MLRSGIAVVLALLLLGAGGMCDGKVVVDPNLSRPAAISSSSQDDRLNRPVTIAARYKTVSVILAQLTEASGVRLIAGSNSKDWQTRSRKLHVYATKVPLNQLMNSIARVTGLKWKLAEAKGTPSYRLVYDRRAVEDAKARLEKQRQKWLADRVKVRKKAVTEYVRLADMTEEDAQQLEVTNPYLYRMSKSSWSKSMFAVLKSIPQAREAFENGQKLRIKLGDLPQPLLKRIADAMDDLDARSQRTSAETGVSSGFSYAEAMTKPGKAVLEIDPWGEEPSGFGEETPIGHMGIVFGSGGQVSTDFADPMSPAVQKHAQDLQRMIETGQHVDLHAQTQAAREEFLAALDWGERMPEHNQSPSLKKLVKPKLKGDEMDEVLDQLPKITGLGFVCDDWEAVYDRPQLPEKETSVEMLMRSVSTKYSRVWDLQGSIIEMRDRLWVKKLRNVVPENVPRVLQARLDKPGFIDLADLAILVELENEQIDNLLREEGLDRLDPIPLEFEPVRPIAAIWAALSDLERQSLLSGAAIDLSLLRERCPEAFKPFKEDALLSYLKISEGRGTTLRVSRTSLPANRGFRYTLVLSDPSWDEEEKTEFSTPNRRKTEDRPKL